LFFKYVICKVTIFAVLNVDKTKGRKIDGKFKILQSVCATTLSSGLATTATCVSVDVGKILQFGGPVSGFMFVSQYVTSWGASQVVHPVSVTGTPVSVSFLDCLYRESLSRLSSDAGPRVK
jgi:hypothetical protein